MRVTSLLRNAPKYTTVAGKELHARAQVLTSAGWQLSADDRYMSKIYHTTGFSAAWAFLTQVAMHAHLKGHHPRIHNLYDVVKLTLHTDDTDCLTTKDLELATKFEAIAKKYIRND